jgi:hypothetical protein
LRNQSEQVIQTLGNFINSHLTENQTTSIKSYNVEINYKKRKLTNNNESIQMENFNIQLPPVCEMIYKGNKELCKNKLINQQVKILNSALIGLNGDNETNVGRSKSISLSFYDENDGTEMQVNNQTNPIEFWIQKDFTSTDYTFYNLTYSNDLFLINTFIKSTTNSSVHIQIKPNNLELGYLMLFMFNDIPILTSSDEKYDIWKLYCPSGIYFKYYNFHSYLPKRK